MCGRYGYAPPPQKVARHFSLADLPAIRPNPDVTPGTFINVVGYNPHKQARGIASVKWGFVPDWDQEPLRGRKQINAKAETVHQLPMWRDSFRTKRCIVPADRWYEWPGKKRTMIHRKDTDLIGFAGLWSLWEDGKDRLLSGAIITTEPADWFRPVHHRMPAILHPDDYEAWLAPETPVDKLRSLLRPWEGDDFEFRQVSRPEFVQAVA